MDSAQPEVLMSRMTTSLLAILLLVSSSPLHAASVHLLLRGFLEGEGRSTALPAALRGSSEEASKTADRVGVWVRTIDGGRSLEAAGLLPSGTLSNPRPADWTRTQLRAAMLDPNVQAIAPAVRCFPRLDKSLEETNTTVVHQVEGSPPDYIGLTGEGIVVGIVDSGVDLAHEDFRDEMGNTRLVCLWDQTIGSSDPPVGFSYGKEWTADQINAGQATTKDFDGHGTHVFGIAVGDGSATGGDEPAYTYVGMAPRAEIIGVKTDYLTNHIAEGVAYVFQKADSLGLPAVVNLSLGTHYGPHDGTSDFASAVSALAGPGRLVVSAAGNERGDGIHAERTLTAPDSAIISFVVPDYDPRLGSQNDEINLDGWYAGGSHLAITLITPSQDPVGPVFQGDQVAVSTSDGWVEIDNGTFPASNGDHEVYIWIYDRNSTNPPGEGTWKIRLDALSTPAGSTEFDLWNFLSTIVGPRGERVEFFLGIDDSELVSAPATGDSVIAVAAYITKNHWTASDGRTYGYSPPVTEGQITGFSSVGPRRDGVLKPEIAAPGMAIGSARSSDATFLAEYILEDEVHGISQGTSQSAPHVTGLVALMFEEQGPMSVAAALNRMTSTARIDGFTGSDLPDSVWGYGKIDALKATGYIVPVTLIEATAVQAGDRVQVRFLLSEDAGRNPLPVWRLDPGASKRKMIGHSSSGSARTYVDSTLVTGGVYHYWLSFEENGVTNWIGPASVQFVRNQLAGIQISPNPFVEAAEIRWGRLPGRATVTIFDASGRRIRKLRSNEVGSGSLLWDGTDGNSHPVPAGVYFLRFEADGAETILRKLMRLR
jgi:subtilisin family serine protease